MPMTAGSVALQDDGSYSATGLAQALMDAHVAGAEALVEIQSPGSMTHPNVRLAVRRQLAVMANAYAGAIVAHLQANAKAHVTGEVLARIPAIVAGAADIDVRPPAAPVDIPIL